MAADTFSNPDNTVIQGELTVKRSPRTRDTGVSFDDGLIVSDGLGDLIVNTLTTATTQSNMVIASDGTPVIGHNPLTGNTQLRANLGNTVQLQAGGQNVLTAAANGIQSDGGLFKTDGTGNVTAVSYSSGSTGSGVLTVYNVLGYGAKGDNSHDDTAAINNAIIAANTALGGIVFFPPGIYKTTSTILFPAGCNNVILMGAGYNSVIKPSGSTQFNVISTTLPPAWDTAGFRSKNIGITQLQIECSSIRGQTGVTGQGNAVYFYATIYGFIDFVNFRNCDNWAIILDSDNSNGGYTTHVDRCLFESNNGCILMVNAHENNYFYANTFNEMQASTTKSLQPAFTHGAGQSTDAMHIWSQVGINHFVACEFGNGGAGTNESVRLSNVYNRFINCHWDNVPAQCATLSNVGHMFIGCEFSRGGETSSKATIDVAGNGHIIEGCIWDGVVTNRTYCINELSGSHANSIYSGNYFITGASGVINQNAASTNRIYGNVGYNPVGVLGPPVVPSTTAAYTNKYGVDCTVFIAASGATITVIAIGGSTTGATSGMFRVPAGQTITLTYTGGTPTWTWFGD
jgi:hypothetical protein